MLKKLKLRISVIKTALLIWLFLSGYAFADLSNEVKWNANLVVVEAAIKAGDYREAFALLQGPAKEGHAKSQYYMGMFYHNGLGVLEDVVEASVWYRLAAEQGDAESQNELGDMYYYGDGVPLDHNEAVKWFRFSAEKGDAYGQLNLGFMYANGYGVIEDKVHALMWWYIASSNGNENAKEYIEEFEEIMTTSQIKEAQRLSKECMKKDYKGC